MISKEELMNFEFPEPIDFIAEENRLRSKNMKQLQDFLNVIICYPPTLHRPPQNSRQQRQPSPLHNRLFHHILQYLLYHVFGRGPAPYPLDIAVFIQKH